MDAAIGTPRLPRWLRVGLCLASLILPLGELAGQEFSATARELVVAYPVGEYSLDPLHTFSTVEAQLFTGVYEGLVAYDPITLNPVAGQAERWEISRDRRTYRFFLREDAKFSNGDTLTAQHFRSSWLRILEPGAAAEYSFMYDVITGVPEYRTGRAGDERRLGIRVISDQILEVELAQPAAHFLKTLAHHSFSAIHPSYLGAINWDRAALLIGNGPFRVREWVPERLLLERNPHYWGASRVQLDRIRIVFSNDFASIVDRFLAGDVHWANIPVGGDDCRLPFVLCNQLFATSYFFFRTDNEPFDDARVRRGLALLLPWDQIRDPELLYPRQPAHSLVPPITDYSGLQDQLDCRAAVAIAQREAALEAGGDLGGDPPPAPSAEATSAAVEECRELNRAQARRLLGQAGYANALGLPPIIIKVREGSTADRIAEIMKETWETETGAEVTIQAFGGDQFVAEVQAGGFTLSHQTWVGDFADPVTFLQMWTEASNLNDARYVSRRYERALGDADRRDGPARTAALERAEQMLLDDSVILPISRHVALNLLHRGRVSGWYRNALDIHPFRFITFRRVTGPPGVASLAGELAG